MSAFELSPLRFDNLLAFLALLGLLRALDRARPDWRVRAFWRRAGGRGPWTAVLDTAGSPNRAEVVDAAIDGIRELAEPIAEMARRLTGENDPARLLQEAQKDPRRAEAVSALLGVTIERATPGRKPMWRVGTRYTPFLPKPTAARQNFVARIAEVTRGLDGCRGGTRRGRRGRDMPTLSELLDETLFEAWRLRPSPLALRWDPGEFRSWALRWQDPSKEPAETVEAAVRLAVLAIPLFPLHPVHGGATAPGFLDPTPRRLCLRWPLWSPPARPAAIRSLLSHPGLVADRPDRSRLAPHGVVELVECRVAWLGNPPNDYPNFTRGEALWGGAAS